LCLQKIPYSAFADHFFIGIQKGEIKTRCIVDAGKQSLEKAAGTGNSRSAT
jgi:hypothetical protein